MRFKRKEENYYTVNEISQMFNVPAITIRNWIARKDLKVHQYGKGYPVMITIDDWYDVPAYMRARYIKRQLPKKSVTKLKILD